MISFANTTTIRGLVFRITRLPAISSEAMETLLVLFANVAFYLKHSL